MNLISFKYMNLISFVKIIIIKMEFNFNETNGAQ
jgi:hypothetical protein